MINKEFIVFLKKKSRNTVSGIPESEAKSKMVKVVERMKA